MPNNQILDLRSSFLGLLHPDDKAAAVEGIRAHLEEHKPDALDFRLRCKNVIIVGCTAAARQSTMPRTVRFE